MTGRGKQLAAALQRRKDAEQARAQTPAVQVGAPQVPPIPTSRPSTRPQTPVPSGAMGLPVSEQARGQTPTAQVGATQAPPLPTSRPRTRPQTPATLGAMGPPPVPPMKTPSGRQTPSTVQATGTPTTKSPAEITARTVGRGRAALLAKAKILTTVDKPQHDNQSEMSFRSEDFETSSRKGAVGGASAVSGQLESLKISSSQPAATQISPKTTRSTTPSHNTSPKEPQLYRGMGGKPLSVTANYLQLRQKKEYGIFEYEVKFSPQVDNRDQRFKLVNQQREILGPAKSFDGTKLYVPKQFTDTEVTKPSLTNTGETVDVTFKYKKQKKQGDWDMVYILNVQFNKIMRTLQLVQHNRNFFDPSVAHKIPAYNLEVWPGYVTAVDMFEGGLLLQCDVVSRVLRTETVMTLLSSIFKKCGAATFKSEAEKALLGTSVLTRYNNKSYVVDDIDFDSSPMSTFTNHLGQTMTFFEYYQKNYNIKIQDTKQPLLVSRVKKRAQATQAVESIINLVPELCLMSGLTDAMRADFKIMKEVGNFTRVSPELRQQKLEAYIKRIKENPEAKAHLEDWGYEVCPTTVKLGGRILDPEVICFGNNYRERVSEKADWGRAATTKHVLTAIPVNKWAVFYLDKNEPIVKNFCKCIQQQGSRMGINYAGPKIVKLANDRTETFLKAIRDAIVPDAQLIVTIFPQMRTDRYSAVKKLCYVDMPIASQVINLKTISNEKKLVSVVQKIALQINCKLGGELWACTTPFKDLMVVGIDVYHDKTSGGRSVAGVVTSLNDTLSRYYSVSVIQQQGQEVINALTTAFVQGMVKYYEVNNRWPAHIVVFRDGVGDGQLDTTAKHEAGQFIRAFQHITEEGNGNGNGNGHGNGNGNGNGNGKRWSGKLEDLSKMLPNSYSPGFTFVVVQKRINTRILAIKSNAPKPIHENPPPGTVLDHTVTRFKYKDFFLVPQNVNQGTVSPTHFIVLRELGTEPEFKKLNIPILSATDVQKLAYKLTHMYFNWPGTVRVPSPVQYAHKLCDIVGQHLHRVPSPDLNDRLYYL